MKKAFIFSLLFVLFSCSNEYNQGEQELRVTSNLRFVSVFINGEKANLILDSGAGSTILDLNFTKYIGLNTYRTDSEFAGIGGVSESYATERFELIVLGDTMKYSSKALNLSQVRYKFHQSGYNIHGILGGDFLSRKGCVIDYNSNTLKCNKL